MGQKINILMLNTLISKTLLFTIVTHYSYQLPLRLHGLQLELRRMVMSRIFGSMTTKLKIPHVTDPSHSSKLA